ncbi:MAG: ribosome small subunit-dependent GTPase A [Provencibacterium sp.]|jgi:ribosome biogenesis GTPase|nr:ribosome small subunit-dependent GTPase A [Provencibacterium sp.]
MFDWKEYGLLPEQLPKDAQGTPARVSAVHKQRYGLICGQGEIYGKLKPGAYFEGAQEFPTVGDFVLIQYVPTGDSRILQTLPRKTFFVRRDPVPGGGEQAVAANFDYVFIVQSLGPNFNIRRLERYLALAWQSKAVPVVVLTKADLFTGYETCLQAAQRAAPGVAVHVLSSRTGEGMKALSAYLQPGKTTVFLGSSGVGKSSLINALAGEELMAVGEIREDGRGRHTTTHRQLHRLPGGAIMIDTPGMRELGMWAVSDGLDEAFADVEQFLGRCRFADCTHREEPGCAVRQAIEEGILSRARWESYRSLRGEAAYAQDRAEFLRQKQQRNRNIAKMHRQLKRRDKKQSSGR